MIYKEISGKDYLKLRDTTGAYLVLSFNYKVWYLNGLYHRDDGPAVEWANGAKAWWLNGFLHREDGPAIEEADGTKQWYIRGEYYLTEEEWESALDELRAKEIKDLIV